MTDQELKISPNLTPVESIVHILGKDDIRSKLQADVETSLTDPKALDITADRRIDGNGWNAKYAFLEKHFSAGLPDRPLTQVLLQGLIDQVPGKETKDEQQIIGEVDVFTLGVLLEVAPIVGLRDEDVRSLNVPEAVQQKLTRLEPVIKIARGLAAPVIVDALGNTIEGMSAEEQEKKFIETYIKSAGYYSEDCGRRVGVLMLEAYIDNQSSILQAQLAEAQQAALHQQTLVTDSETHHNTTKGTLAEVQEENTALTQKNALQAEKINNLTTELATITGQLETEKSTNADLTRQFEAERAKLQEELTATRDTQTNLLRDASEAKELATHETERANNAEQRASEEETRAREAEQRAQTAEASLQTTQTELNEANLTNGIQLLQIEAYTRTEEDVRAVLNDIMHQITTQLEQLPQGTQDEYRGTLESYLRRLKAVVAGLNTTEEKKLVHEFLEDSRKSYEAYLTDPKNRIENRRRLAEAQQNYYHMLWHEKSEELLRDIEILDQAGIHINQRDLYNGYDYTDQWKNETNMSKMPQALLMKVYPLTKRSEPPFTTPAIHEAAINLYTKLRDLVEQVSDCYVLDDRLESYESLTSANHDLEQIVPTFKQGFVNPAISALQALVVAEKSYPGLPGLYRIHNVEKVGIVRKTSFANDKSIQAVNAIVTFGDANSKT